MKDKPHRHEDRGELKSKAPGAGGYKVKSARQIGPVLHHLKPEEFQVTGEWLTLFLL